MMTTPFTPAERATLQAICNTLAPPVQVAAGTDDPGFAHRRASDLNIPTALETVFTELIDPGSRSEIRLALALLENPLINGIISRIALPFSRCNEDQRTQIMQSWAYSDLFPLRKAFQAFKRLTLFFFYTLLDENGYNPNWEAIRYPGPPTPPELSERPIRPLSLSADSSRHVVLTADAVVIGSGAGGSVVAAALARAGADVILVEKGGYYAESDFHGRELASSETLFEGRGLLSTDDLGVAILAGTSLGGGTTVNWSASFRTPPHVLEEWSRLYGITDATGSDYQSALDSVCARLNVNTQHSPPNFQNAALERGGKALGYQVGVIARNVDGCEDCGFCNFGCQFGAKNSTTRTYLLDAHRDGARIITHAEADRILIERGQAVGITGTARDSNGDPITFTIRAKVVVAAGGAINTPTLLLRSGLTNVHIGRNLHLHPTTVSYGLYADPVRGWSGPIMTRYVSHFNRITDGYGVSIQTAPVHPGLAALVLNWKDGAAHKAMMAQIEHLANLIVITRDRDGGRVYLDRHGRAKIAYTLSDYDKAHMQAGLLESLRIHRAAGSAEIGAPHTFPYIFESSQDDSAFENYLGRVKKAGLHKNSFALLSAHQMSSARMAANPALGVIRPDGMTFEVRNLFVADGSALPTALGVNPMITIMAVAQGISHAVVEAVG